MSMRGDSKKTQLVAAPASAADDSSSADRSLPAAAVAAGARGIVPRAQGGSELTVIYSGESDVPDTGKTLKA